MAHPVAPARDALEQIKQQLTDDPRLIEQEQAALQLLSRLLREARSLGRTGTLTLEIVFKDGGICDKWVMPRYRER